jgi:hypothetical protein
MVREDSNMASPDIYTNRMGLVLVVAPAPGGRLTHLIEERNVIFQRDGSVIERGITRWIFADIAKGTLQDEWGNAYNHQAHSLLVGNLADGIAFVAALAEQGLKVEEADQLFVPLQTLDPCSQLESDQLRHQFPRAFAVARRETPQISDLVTVLRDAMIMGRG